MTPPQAKWLARANAAGLIEWMGTKGIMHSNWQKMMERLVEAGLVVPYTHGGYELTAAGRAALPEAKRLAGGRS